MQSKAWITTETAMFRFRSLRQNLLASLLGAGILVGGTHSQAAHAQATPGPTELSLVTVIMQQLMLKATAVKAAVEAGTITPEVAVTVLGEVNAALQQLLDQAAILANGAAESLGLFIIILPTDPYAHNMPSTTGIIESIVGAGFDAMGTNNFAFWNDGEGGPGLFSGSGDRYDESTCTAPPEESEGSGEEEPSEDPDPHEHEEEEEEGGGSNLNSCVPDWEGEMTRFTQILVSQYILGGPLYTMDPQLAYGIKFGPQTAILIQRGQTYLVEIDPAVAGYPRSGVVSHLHTDQVGGIRAFPIP